MIGLGEVIIAMIVIGLPTVMIAWAIHRTYRHKEMKLELEAQIAAARSDKSPNTSRLEQRVRVLERIVTDRGIDVAHEIERLRAPSEQE